MPEICEFLVARWPDVLDWLWYFYIACFEKNLVNKEFKKDMQWHLCMVYVVVCTRDKCTLAIANIPGTIRLATLICMLDTECTFLDIKDTIRGSFTLTYILQISHPLPVDIFLLDEVLEAMGGNAELLVDTTIARLVDALDKPELVVKAVGTYVALFSVLGGCPDHPLSVALDARNPVVILTKVLLRLLDILSEASSGRFSPEYAPRLRHTMIVILMHLFTILAKGPGLVKKALQALQSGIMTFLIECAPVAFAFDPLDRDGMVDLLKKLTCLTTRIPIARQASAELERLERKCSVQARFNASTLNVRNAWVTFYDAILARRTILAQIQALDSTPMACDNCFKFDERANFKKCAGCGKAHYCSRECQSRAWKEKSHRAECNSSKTNSAKSRRRAATQEKYFLARVAVNDAQHQKEHLKQMACIGLNYLKVTVDYTEFPPRCTVACDKKELSAHMDKTTEISDVTSRILDYGVGESRLSELFQGTSSSLNIEAPTSSVLKSLGEVGVTESGGSEMCRIQLVDGDLHVRENPDSCPNVPPVHLIVILPGDDDDDTSLRREERFVIDDYWEFVHIKFEDTGRADLPSELFEFEEKDEKEKYDFVYGKRKHSPDFERLVKLSLLGQSMRAAKAKEEAEGVGQRQDELMKLIKTLGSSRAKAVDDMLQAAKIVSALKRAEEEEDAKRKLILHLEGELCRTQAQIDV
ncbi:hypothetical protein SCHPADRAFT_350829 [Schizopora paradoxa]|uniref:MYND-type domain-containing protein n=1 Tax=Schizopora paradoxa TaxID=27342 RepID=A0A0H2RP32_9AGAM|nr:hypothetical protein SCHPADRAFT_350829 [Schizopora paradoxa]